MSSGNDLSVATAKVTQPKTWPIPVPAMIVAVLLAALGTLPMLGDLTTRLTEIIRAVVAVVPNLTRAALVLSRTGTGELGAQLAVLSAISVALLLLGGLAIARAVPRESPLQGGAR